MTESNQDGRNRWRETNQVDHWFNELHLPLLSFPAIHHQAAEASRWNNSLRLGVCRVCRVTLTKVFSFPMSPPYWQYIYLLKTQVVGYWRSQDSQGQDVRIRAGALNALCTWSKGTPWNSGIMQTRCTRSGETVQNALALVHGLSELKKKLQSTANFSFSSDALGCSLSGKALRIRVEWEQACAAQQRAIAAGSAKNSNWWSATEMDQLPQGVT